MVATRRDPARAQFARHAEATYCAHNNQTAADRVALTANPEGAPVPSDYEIVSEELPPLADGQMLLKTKYLSLDPYMRSEWMNSPRNIGASLPAPPAQCRH